MNRVFRELISGVRDHSWFLFFCFLTANLLISYTNLPLSVKLAIGIGGLLIPFIWAAYSKSQNRIQNPLQEFSFPVAWWAWALLVAAAIFMRLYKIDTATSWPNYEEGFIGYFALELFEKWNWRLFYSSADIPMGYLWGLCLAFKMLGPSLWTLRLYPALLSLLTVPMGYLAARQFFSKSFSFLTVFLLAVSFWPVYLGCFGGMVVTLPLWQCLCFYLAGMFLKAPVKDKNKWSVLLGLGVGVGFYTYHAWFIVAFSIGLIVIGYCFQKKNFYSFGYFAFASFLLLCPLLLAAWKENFGVYIQNLWAFSNPIPLMDQVKISLSYFAFLFWGKNEIDLYSPAWGGFFNPLIVSVFFLGFLKLLKSMASPLSQWLLLSLLFCFVPTVLTKNFEPFRMVPLMALVLVIALLGFVYLLSLLPREKWMIFISLFLITSFALDFHELDLCRTRDSVPEHFQTFLKSSDRYEAYQVLKRISSEAGPGFIFSDFVPGFCDETLTLADYGFNANGNSALADKQATWAAVMTYADEKPYLSQRFPDGKAYYISKTLHRPDGGFMLWVFPIWSERQETIRRWQRASCALKPFIDQCLSYRAGEPFQPVIDSLMSAYPSFEDDPFLKSYFWQMMADSCLKKLNLSNHSESISCLRKAFISGYPTAHLSYDLGMYWFIDGNRVEARKAFSMALKSPLNLTDSNLVLRELK